MVKGNHRNQKDVGMEGTSRGRLIQPDAGLTLSKPSHIAII